MANWFEQLDLGFDQLDLGSIQDQIAKSMEEVKVINYSAHTLKWYSKCSNRLPI